MSLWLSILGGPLMGINVVTRLGFVKDKSIIFNKEVFSNIFKNKRIIEARIKGIHRQLNIFPYSALIKLEKEL